MTNLTRLKLYLNQKPYYGDQTDEIYEQILLENGLDGLDEYSPENDKKAMLLSVYDILSNLANDIKTYRKVETEFITIADASANISARLKQLKAEIDELSEIERAGSEDNYNKTTSYLFFNNPRG